MNGSENDIFQTKPRLVSAIFFYSTVVFFAAVGGAIGLWFNATADVVYQSEVVFRVSPKWLPGEITPDSLAKDLVRRLAETPHHQLFGSRSNIEKCLSDNNLFVLDSFVDLSKEQAVDLIEKNIESDVLDEHGTINKFSLALNNPQDCATVLNNLVRSYHTNLVDDFPKLKEHIKFKNLQVARVGDQIYPLLPKSLAVWAYIGLLIGMLIWFIINPFKLTYFPISIGKIFSILGLFSIVVGVTTLVLWFQLGKQGFESSSKIEIVDNASKHLGSGSTANQKLAQLAVEPHEIAFRQYATIERTLDRNNLFVIDMFVDLSKEEVVEFVQRNLEVTKSEETPNVYTVNYRGSLPDETVLVLDSLISGYNDILTSPEKRHPVSNRNAEASAVQGIPVTYKLQVLSSATQPTKANYDPLSKFEFIMIVLASVFFGLVICTTWIAMGSQKLDNEVVLAELVD